MVFFSWSKWLRSLSRQPRKPHRKRKPTPVRTRLETENLEDRTLFAVLPPALITDPSTIATSQLSGFSPSIALDPANPLKMIEVHTTGSLLIGNYSINGGQTWTPFINPNPSLPNLGNLADPTLNPPPTPVPPVPFSTVTNPTVAIDRAENIYIVDVEHNPDNTAGALVLHRYSFAGGGPFAIDQNIIVQRWTNADPILNPVVAVDNNVPTFTDPLTGATQTDTMAALSSDPNHFGFQVPKALFIAWNTANTAPATAPTAPQVFNPNVIMVAGSDDGGTNWTAPQLVNAGGHIVTPVNGVVPHYSDPQIVFTQGSADGRVAGGQLVFVWNDFGSRSIKVDASQPDNGVDTNLAAESHTFAGDTGPITEASAVVTGATVSSGGTNYNVGDVLSLAGGTPATTGATFTVATTTSGPPGPVGTITGPTANSYLVVPPSPNNVTGGAGTGAQLNLTFGPDIAQTTTYTSTVSLPSNFIVNDLEVTLNLTDPNLSHLSIDLVQPGPGGAIIHLVRNRVNVLGQTIDANGNPIPPSTNPPVGITGADLGVLNGFQLGTVFADNAPRTIADASFSAPYIARFRPEVGSLNQLTGISGGLAGDSPNISGDWKLVITDFRNDRGTTAPAQKVDSWSLRFSHVSTTGFGSDRTLSFPTTPVAPTTPVRGAAVAPYPTVTAASGPQGIGPGFSVAVDNTLGDFSPYQGRLYIAYTAVGGAALTGGVATDTDVYLISADNLTPSGITFKSPRKVNDDSAADNFSEGTRPQFMPTVAVDQETGTVGVMYYDGRWDPARTRVANSFSASIDGGQTFSPSAFLNTPKTATDMITGKTVTLEPIPGNQAQAPTESGFGDRQGLVMSGGHVVPVFSSNDNIATRLDGTIAGSDIKTATVTVAAGPRIIFGDMGPITSTFTTGGVVHNNTFTSDGTRQFTGFVVVFDRPVDPGSFNGDDVTVEYRDTVRPLSQPPNLTLTGASNFTVTPLDPTSVGWGPETLGAPLATTFLVSLNTPLSGVGTYSYAVGPNIHDDIRSTNTSGGALAVVTSLTGDVSDSDFNVATSPTFGPVVANQLIFATSGYTHSHGGSVDILVEVHNPNTGIWTTVFQQNLNNSAEFDFNGLTINFPDQPVDQIRLNSNPFQDQSFHNWFNLTLSVNGPGGTGISNPGNLMDLDQDAITGVLGHDAFAAPTPVNGIPFQLPYRTDTLPLIIPGPHLVDTSVAFNPANNPSAPDNLILNGTNNAIDVTFDRNIDPATFTPANILRFVGPLGPITTYTLGPAVSFTGGGGSGAAGFATIVGGVITAVTITDPGSGYTSPPTVVFTGGGGVLAAGTAIISGGQVVGVVITNPGAGYTSSPPQAIPDGGTLNVPLTITDSLQVNNLSVGLNISHTRVSDLTVTLIAPDGTQVPLFSGGSGANLTNTVFDGFAATPFTAGTGPYTGIFRPAGNLASLNGKNYLGTWTLQITDGATGETGTLDGWSLNPLIVTPNPPGGTPNRTFRITFPTQSVSGTYSLLFGADTRGNYITDANGNRVDTNLNAGVDLLRGGTLTGGSLIPTTYPSGVINQSIPAGQTIESKINVTDSFLVQGVTLQLTIQHQNDPDLTAVLIAPDGTSVKLFSGVGATGSTPHANFTNTTFDDAAPTPIQLATTQPVIGIGAGPYNPQLPLSLFKGHGSLGGWTLRITSNSSTLDGTLVNWSLTLKNSVAGLGETVADQFTAPFRIFTQDPTNNVSQDSWTAVGPASIEDGGAAGRIGGLAVDPSDPSGNTVYTAGASGGVWKTTNFLTTSPLGPTWIPLTDFGPGNSLNTESIAVFPRNNDPNQSIVIVATGEGDTGSPGVGFLRSMDGGRTWRVLDSTTNADASGNILPINSGSRDHAFVGMSSYKVIVDPKLSPSGEVIIYAATSSGIWRSTDTGKHWTRILTGNGQDVVLAAGSAGSTGNLQILYAAVQNQGVYFTTNAPTTQAMVIRNGGGQNPIRRDVDVTPDTAVPVAGTSGINPGGNNGRILLAAPALTGNPLQDTLYEGWCYAEVVSATGTGETLYVTKDFGLNWTKIRTPVKGTGLDQIPTNDDSIATDYSVVGTQKFPQGNYNHSLAVDPNNPAVLYMGGTADGNPYGFIRIDTTANADPYAEVAYDNSNNDGGLVQFSTQGPVTLKTGGTSDATGLPLGPGRPYGMLPGLREPYLNMLRDPDNPFLTPASLQFSNIASFGNTGQNNRWMPFTGGGLGGSDQHSIVALRDPLTGHTRIIFGDDHGVWTGTDRGDGTPTGNVGNAVSVVGSRNGNLQITQFYDGATQPSTLAADLAGALFYGVAQDDGWPKSNKDVLDTGDIVWDGPGEGDASGVKTDQTGSGTVYYYKWPCCGGSNPLPTDFWSVVFPGGVEVSRTTGLIQNGDNPGTNQGQWPFLGGSRFAVNPIDSTAIVMSSQAGRIFLTSGPSLGTGVQWFPIGDPTDLDSTYAPALAFGAPADANAPLSEFIYAGTNGGHIFVTFTGGGVGTKWKDISAGLDGSPVQFIVTNPNRGSHEAYAVTRAGVYWMANSAAASPTWVKITGNLFSQSLTRTLFNDPAQSLPTLKALSSLQADWRYAIPDNLANPNGPTHPVLYVGGIGGVYRSLDKGATWTYFPDITIDGALQAGGLLPTASSLGVTDLALSLGNINPLNGTPDQPYGRNMLVATTYGRGVFAIRLDDQIVVPGGNPLYTYAVTPVAGPHVVSIAPSNNSVPLTGITVSFSGPVDPVTFTPADILSLTDPAGNPVAVSGVVDITGGSAHNIFKIVFAVPQTAFGFYHVSFGPNISDFAGNRMDQNQNALTGGANGEDPGDIYTARFLFQPGTNFAPVLNSTTAPFPAILEDANPNPGSDLPTFIGTSLISDQNDASYVPPVAPRGIAITGVDDTYGVWEYSTDGGVTWVDLLASGPLSDTNARALEVVATNRIRFLPDPNYNSNTSPSPSFTFRAWDLTSGLTSTGGDNTLVSTIPNGGNTAYSSTTATANLTVTAVNDPPSFTKGPDVTVLEDSGTSTFTGWATNLSAGPPDESGQALDFLLNTDNSALFVVLPAIAPDGTLTFTLAPDANGSATVTVRLHDDGGTANGGIDTSDPQSFVISVTAVNDPPSFTKGPDVTVLEDAGPQTIANWATNISAGPPDESSQVVTFVVTGNTNPSLFASGPAIASDGTLTFTTAVNANGSATITVVAQDDGGTADGGVDTSAPQTFVINVTPVNDPPSFTKGPDVTALEDSGLNTIPNWATNISAGPPDESGQNVVFLITGNTNPGIFSVAPAIAPDGTLTFTTATDANGSSTITVVAQDDGGTANGGIDTSAPQTFTIMITAVNDPPSFTKGPDQTVLEDAGPQTVPNWATNISAGPPDESGQNVIFIVTDNSNPSLFASGPAIASDGTLTYTTAPDANGSAIITVVAQDDGGTDNGGNDTSPPQTFVINVTPVNDPPSFTKGPDQTVLEDAGPQTVPNWATNISAGPPDESGQNVIFIVTDNSNPSLFATAPSIAPDGTLTFTTAPDANGSATITVVAQDDGGTANGGINTSAAQTFVISVTAVNDPPSFTKGPDVTVLEDAGPQTIANWATNISAGPPDESGQVVTFIITGNSNPSLFATGPAIASDGTLTFTTAADANGSATITVVAQDDGGTANGGIDTSAPQSFTINVTAVNDPPTFTKGPDQTVLEDSGTHTVSNWATNISAGPPDESGQNVSFLVTGDSNPALFAVPPAIAPDGTLTYTLAADANGSATITVVAQDDGGIANGGIDTSAPQSFTINVTPVNDPPSFTTPPEVTVLEDAGPETVSNFATNISAGPPDESGQTVTFYVTGNSNPGLFAVPPSLAPDGTLTFTTAPNANGTATITVVAQDDGGTANGGVDTSSPQIFTINVTPVNDVPSFTKGPDITVAEDAGPQTMPNWPSNVSAGPPDESSQVVSFIVNNDNNALFTVQPAIAPDGTLTFTTALHATGTATVTVAAHDDGGTANGGVDTSATQTFLITVRPGVNVTITSSVNPSVYGQPVTFTATVTPISIPGTPTGSVVFMDGNTTLGTGALSAGGVATFTTSLFQLGVGSHTITASYAGDSNYAGNSASLTQTVGAAGTTTTLTAAPAKGVKLRAITFTAHVAAVFPGAGIPTGQVVFVDTTTGAALGAAALDTTGTATFQHHLGGPLGKHTVQATYQGDGNFAVSVATTVVKIVANGTRTSSVTLKSSGSPSIVGTPVTFTATVRDTGGTPLVNPGGTVVFQDKSDIDPATGKPRVLGYGKLVMVSTGVMRTTLTINTLSVTDHNIVAKYSGNALFAVSISNVFTQKVLDVPTRTSSILLTEPANQPDPSPYGKTLLFSATVTDSGTGGAQTPSGTVTFTDTTTNTVVGTATLAAVSNGVAKATLSTNLLAVGPHSIVATYNGDLLFAPSAAPSNAVTQTITVSSSLLKLTTSLTPSKFGQAVTFKAAVTSGSGGGVPTGLVTFKEGNLVLGTGTIDAGGFATFTTSGLSVGTHLITAVYGGDANFTGSDNTATPLTQQVVKSSTTATLSRSTADAKQPLTLTATILAVAPGAGLPTGSVTFVIDGIDSGTVGMTNGVAALFLPNGLTQGTHTIVVKYLGDGNFNASNTSFTYNFGGRSP